MATWTRVMLEEAETGVRVGGILGEGALRGLSGSWANGELTTSRCDLSHFGAVLTVFSSLNLQSYRPRCSPSVSCISNRLRFRTCAQRPQPGSRSRPPVLTRNARRRRRFPRSLFLTVNIYMWIIEIHTTLFSESGRVNVPTSELTTVYKLAFTDFDFFTSPYVDFSVFFFF